MSGDPPFAEAERPPDFELHRIHRMPRGETKPPHGPGLRSLLNAESPHWEGEPPYREGKALRRDGGEGTARDVRVESVIDGDRGTEGHPVDPRRSPGASQEEGQGQKAASGAEPPHGSFRVGCPSTPAVRPESGSAKKI